MFSKNRKWFIQPLIAFIIFFGYLLTVILMGTQNVFANKSSKMTVNAIFGLLIGYVLQRGFFGFAGTTVRTSKGNPRLAYAVLGMFAIVAILVALIGATPSGSSFYNAAFKHARPIGLGTVIGAIIFGMGMVLSKGCASGALTDMSSGSLRVAIVLVFFVIGAGPGQMVQKELFDTGLDQKVSSLAVYVSDSQNGITPAGWIIASLLTLVMLGAMAITAYLDAKKIRNKNNLKLKNLRLGMNEVPDKYEEWIKSTNMSISESDKTFSKGDLSKFYFHTFVSKFSLFLTAGLFAVLLIAVIAVNEKGWGVTTSFARMFDWIFNVSEEAGGFKPGKQSTILSDSGTWRNFGIVIGAVAYILSCNKFKIVKTFKGFKSLSTWRTYLIAALGGFMLGFGARMANGCNAGQWATGVTTFSLSGWIFGIFMTLGAVLMIWLNSRKGLKKILCD